MMLNSNKRTNKQKLRKENWKLVYVHPSQSLELFANKVKNSIFTQEFFKSITDCIMISSNVLISSENQYLQFIHHFTPSQIHYLSKWLMNETIQDYNFIIKYEMKYLILFKNLMSVHLLSTTEVYLKLRIMDKKERSYSHF